MLQFKRKILSPENYLAADVIRHDRVFRICFKFSYLEESSNEKFVTDTVFLSPPPQSSQCCFGNISTKLQLYKHTFPCNHNRTVIHSIRNQNFPPFLSSYQNFQIVCSYYFRVLHVDIPFIGEFLSFFVRIIIELSLSEKIKTFPLLNFIIFPNYISKHRDPIHLLNLLKFALTNFFT